MTKHEPRGRRWRRSQGRRIVAVVLLAVVAVAIIAAVPRLGDVMSALADVDWKWAALSVLANIASLVIRGLAWQALLTGVLVDRHAGARVALRAYMVGQLVNAVLLARAGEASKVAVYTEHLDEPGANWGVVAGAVAAHRVLDTVPLSVLILTLAISVGVPGWTVTVLGVSAVVLVAAALIAGRAEESDDRGGVWRLIATLRQGLAVLRMPGHAALAATLQATGWMIEIGGVWLGFQAFGIDAGLSAAGLVVVATNAATLVPFVPGSVGVFQVAVAGALEPVGVRYSAGLAFGVALQAIETLATLSAGLPSAAREGISMGALWHGTGQQHV